jgi:hypothetical protein
MSLWLFVSIDGYSLIIPFSIMYFMPFKKSESEIWPSDHHSALFFIQPGISLEAGPRGAAF